MICFCKFDPGCCIWSVSHKSAAPCPAMAQLSYDSKVWILSMAPGLMVNSHPCVRARFLYAGDGWTMVGCRAQEMVVPCVVYPAGLAFQAAHCGTA